MGGVDLEAAASEFQKHLRFFDRWLQKGMGAEMSYLERGRARRENPNHLLSGVQSVVMVALPYSSEEYGFEDPLRGFRQARYLRGPMGSGGRDYHLEISERLEKMMEKISSELASFSTENIKWKTFVDTSAVLERSWAFFCGLGWIGKNRMLIHPKFGSFFCIGGVFLDHRIKRTASIHKNYCGSCRRCIESCPTQALSEEEGLDARKCVSFWTLEKKDAFQISGVERAKAMNWVAGCDLCQEVCPFNSKSFKGSFTPSDTPSENNQFSWDMFLQSEWAVSENSALNYVKQERRDRNLALALLNSIQSSSCLQNSVQNDQNWKKKIECHLKKSHPIAQPLWQEIFDYVYSSSAKRKP